MENAILYSEVSTVCALVLLLLSVKVKDSMFLQEQRRLFLRVTVSNVIFLALDSIWIFVDNNILGTSIKMNWLLNVSYYMLSGLLGYFWFAYSETIQDSKLVREKKYKLYTLIPEIILIVLTLISIKTGWLFFIDENNVYHRGPVYALQVIISYGYIAVTAAKAFYLSFHTEDYRRKSDLRTLATFVLPTLFAGGLQIFFPGYPILCLGNAFGILYIYLTLQEQLVSLDGLTKLNNRKQLHQYLSTKVNHIHEGKELYLLIMDVDYFKSINDQYGHVEGDKALKAVANCLMKVCRNRNYFIARYGGDEFVVLAEIGMGESVQMICDDIHEELKKVDKPYALSLSIGYVKFETTMKNQAEFIDAADRELYKVKENRPARKIAGR